MSAKRDFVPKPEAMEAAIELINRWAAQEWTTKSSYPGTKVFKVEPDDPALVNRQIHEIKDVADALIVLRYKAAAPQGHFMALMVGDDLDVHATKKGLDKLLAHLSSEKTAVAQR